MFPLPAPRRKKILFFREEKVAGSIVQGFQASAFNRADFLQSQRVAKLSAIPLYSYPLSIFPNYIFLRSKGKFKGKKRKGDFFLRSLGKDNENISVNQERGAVGRLVRAYEALATAAIVPTWKRSLHLVCFLSPPPPSLPLLLARHRDTLGVLSSLSPLYYYFPPLSPRLSAPRGVNHP